MDLLLCPRWELYDRMQPRSLTRSILTAGLVAGTLDIAAALLQYYTKTGKDPANVLRYIASAVFGPKAFSSGIPMAARGLLFHYCIAFLFTISFYGIYSRLGIARKKIMVTVLTGLVYGLFVWAVMNLLVVPLSAAQTGPFVLKKAIVAMLILLFCTGLPLALIARKYYLYKK